MNTKKLFFFAIAALGLAACSNDEVVETIATSEANEIGFRPLVSGVTRVDAKSAFANNDVIDVWAVYNNTKFFQDDYTYNTSTGFTSSVKHYWPSNIGSTYANYTEYNTANGTTLTEEAYNNLSADEKKWFANFFVVYGATTNNGAANKQSAAGTVAHAPHTAAASQTDMLFAKHKSIAKEAPVVLNFRHALSQIVVQAKNTNPNLKVSITGVRIGYVAQSGTLTYTGGVTDTKQALTNGSVTDGVTLISQSNWGNTAPTNANTNKYDQTGLTATELVGNASDTGHGITGFSNWMLLPQNMISHSVVSDQYQYASAAQAGSATGDPDLSGSYIALYMKIENYVNSAVNGELVAYQWCYWPITTNWNPGNKYTYVVDTAQGGYQPQDLDSDKNYDPVLEGSEIKFSVACTIDEWVPTSGTVNF